MVERDAFPKSHRLDLIEKIQDCFGGKLFQYGLSRCVKIPPRPIVGARAKPTRAIAVGLGLDLQPLKKRNSVRRRLRLQK
jgi:hypothetical protein